jgi:hypothetical protein
MIQGLIGGFIFVRALTVFWHIIDEVRDWWRSMREMDQLEKEIDAENANTERRAHYQALVNSAKTKVVFWPAPPSGRPRWELAVMRHSV